MMNKLKLILPIFILILACEGEQGQIGPSGLTSLINVTPEPPGVNCSEGGSMIETGIDTNNDGVLSEGEIQATTFICNGRTGDTGLSSLINISPESLGENCGTGGFRIESGIDLNDNQILETDEITLTQYVCNGETGSNSLTNVTEETQGENCLAGGIKIEIGSDQNNNGALDIEEITATQFICNGGYNGEIRFDFGIKSNPSSSVEGIVFANSSEGEFLENTRSIPNFNINRYTAVDSLAFSAFIQTFNSESKCYAELYDLTNSQVIAGSEISTDRVDFTFVASSSNFLQNFPQETIDLSVRVRSEIDGEFVQLSNPIFYLYRTK